MAEETLVGRATACLFRFNAAVVCAYPVSTILAITLFTLICSIKIPFTDINDDFHFGYTPEDARALVEYKKYNEFSSSVPLMIVVFVTAADGGTMTRLEHLNETVGILDDIGANVKVKNQSFYDICTSFCNLNEPVVQFRNGMLFKSLSRTAVNETNETLFHDLNLRYPMMTAFGHELDLTPNFHGVETYEEGKEPEDAITNIKYLKIIALIQRANRPDSWTAEDADAWDVAIRKRINEVKSTNGMLFKSLSRTAVNETNETLFHDLNLRYPMMTAFGHELDLTPNFHGVETYEEGKEPEDAITNIKYLKIIALIQRANRPDSWTAEDADAWDVAIRKRINEAHNDSLVVPRTFSFPFLQAEITRTSMVTTPYIISGFISVVLFSLITVTLAAWYLDEFSVWKLVYAVVACITPLMATGTCLGLLFLCGLRFGSILLISPFLILALGVDDAYIMINAWERVCIERRKHPVPNDTLQGRITEVLLDAGPSITVTSLTNMLAFAVSALSATPEIRLFCIANVLSMFLDLAFTTTLYLAVMVIGARYEMQRQASGTKYKLGKFSSFLNGYCKCLSNGYTSVCIFMLMCLYWGASIYGIMNITPSVRPSKLLITGSPLEQALCLERKYVTNGYSFVTVIVGDAGDIADAQRRKRIYSLVEQFEAMPEHTGPRFTKLWMRDYEKFVFGDVETDEQPERSVAPENEAYSVASIKEFLKWPEYKHWSAFMNFDTTTNSISKFFFVVPYHGEHISEFRERLRFLNEWRAIADNYTDLSASVFVDDAQFTDQIETLLPQAVQNAVYSFACIALICTLFMQNIPAVFAASASILSIFIGVAGFMTLWGVELGPISTVTIILSIGMSVDYPAHVAYHYYHSLQDDSSNSAHAVMANALSVIAFPLVQCCISNVLIMGWLLLANTYITLVMVKTVFLVVLFGSTHALLIIPAFLCVISRWRFRKSVLPAVTCPTIATKR
ncbi:Patched domain-containing protein 3 [Toxocara canis]|uniref:Patched domain-containing protein 3 n=1 Tax=Toxocara canis TaxID=6265 RepID=A0A0B2V6W1_TOXCA|nr:Patched domain-containing protein 3 [Toxocara canis]